MSTTSPDGVHGTYHICFCFPAMVSRDKFGYKKLLSLHLLKNIFCCVGSLSICSFLVNCIL